MPHVPSAFVITMTVADRLVSLVSLDTEMLNICLEMVSVFISFPLFD